MRVTALCSIVLATGGLSAQDRLPPDAALEKKLASPFLHRADWELDYREALAAARERDVPIFGYFTTANY